MARHSNSGFTLLELSIVLVIIGLLAGAVTVGRDLIRQAEIRAQTSDMDEYKTATNLFKTKYGAMPGDIHYTDAAALGLFTFTGLAAGTTGFGDGNGVLEPCTIAPYSNNYHDSDQCGELIVYWRHLSEAGLIDGNYGQNIDPSTGLVTAGVTPAELSTVLPPAKVGRSAYIAVDVMPGDYGAALFSPYTELVDTNFFYIAGYSPNNSNHAIWTNGRAMRRHFVDADEAVAFDTKTDDGLPFTGAIRASGPSIADRCADPAHVNNNYIILPGDVLASQVTPEWVCVSYSKFN